MFRVGLGFSNILEKGAWNNCEGYEGHVFMMVHVRLLCEYGAL